MSLILPAGRRRMVQKWTELWKNSVGGWWNTVAFKSQIWEQSTLLPSAENGHEGADSGKPIILDMDQSWVVQLPKLNSALCKKNTITSQIVRVSQQAARPGNIFQGGVVNEEGGAQQGGGQDLSISADTSVAKNGKRTSGAERPFPSWQPFIKSEIQDRPRPRLQIFRPMLNWWWSALLCPISSNLKFNRLLLMRVWVQRRRGTWPESEKRGNDRRNWNCWGSKTSSTDSQVFFSLHNHKLSLNSDVYKYDRCTLCLCTTGEALMGNQTSDVYMKDGLPPSPPHPPTSSVYTWTHWSSCIFCKKPLLFDDSHIDKNQIINSCFRSASEITAFSASKASLQGECGQQGLIRGVQGEDARHTWAIPLPWPLNPRLARVASCHPVTVSRQSQLCPRVSRCPPPAILVQLLTRPPTVTTSLVAKQAQRRE